MSLVPGADRAHQRHQRRVDRFHAGQHGQRDREEGDHHDQADLGRQIVAEPQDEDRRERHLGHVLEQHDQRIERAARASRSARSASASADADDGGSHEAEQDLAWPSPGGAERERAPFATSASTIAEGAGTTIGRDREQPNGGFPQHERERRTAASAGSQSRRAASQPLRRERAAVLGEHRRGHAVPPG